MNDWKTIILDEPSLWPKSTLVRLEESHADARGRIQSLANLPMKSASLITSVKGSLRSNHYHLTDWHLIYMLEGCVDYHFRPTGSAADPSVVRAVAGDMIWTPPMEDHATVAVDDSTFLVLSRNPRDQVSYEADVVRVKLLDPTGFVS
jgi:oxalate decarboxylase/phosphoglucose isomerase-like protein (cupin superfamily)